MGVHIKYIIMCDHKIRRLENSQRIYHYKHRVLRRQIALPALPPSAPPITVQKQILLSAGTLDIHVSAT